MNVNGSNLVQSRLFLLGPPARKTLPTMLFQEIGFVKSLSFVDANLARGMEEIAINLKTQFGRELKKRKLGRWDFAIMIRSVA